MVVTGIVEATGMPDDQVRLLLCVFGSLPLGAVQRYLKGATVRLLYGLLVGIAFGFFCFGTDALHCLGTSLGAYVIMCFGPKDIAHKIVYAFMFAYLTGSHIYRMQVDYMGYTMDYTSAQMVITLKVVMIACNLYDGRRTDKLHDEENEDKVIQTPNLLEYLSYIFFYPSFLVGPCFTYNKYMAFVNRDDIPSAVYPAFAKVIQGGLCYGVFMYSVFNPPMFVLEAEFLAHPLYWRIVYLWLSVAAARFKYYTVWSWCEAGCIASGLGYNGKAAGEPSTQKLLMGDVAKDGTRWDLCKAVNIAGVELAQNLKSVTDSWNITVGRFLYVYVYKRLSPVGKRPGDLNVYATQMVSAFWHGFYPGYYLFFILTALMTNAARQGRRYLRPLFVNEKSVKGPFTALKPLYDVLSFLCTVIPLNHAGIAFMVLQGGLTFQAWAAVSWFPQLVIFGFYGTVMALRGPLTGLLPRPKAQ